MLSLPKVIGIVFCGLLLSLWLSAFAQTDISDRRQGGQEAEMEGGQLPVKAIQGEVLRVEGNDCVVKEQDGKEVRLQIDLAPLKAAKIEPGDRIEAYLDDQNHVLFFRPRGGINSP